MIVGNVDQNAAAKPEVRVQSLLAAPKGGRSLSKTVESAMVDDALKDARRQIPVEASLDVVTDQGPQARVGKRINQVKVQKMVHAVFPFYSCISEDSSRL
jgi:helix-turn-helix protein